MHLLAEQLVDTCREMARTRLSLGTTGNASVRCDGNILITPTSMAYDSISLEDMVVLNLNGEVTDGVREPSSEWRVHLAIYQARPEVEAIVHTHSPHAVAWSFLGEEMDTGTEELDLYASGSVRTAEFGPTGTDELAHGAVEALAGRRAVLLARHGVVGVGATPAQALDVCAVVEQQAHVAWLLRGARVDAAHSWMAAGGG